MAFIASSPEARELISKKIGDSELEKQILKKRNDDIPAFGFQHSTTKNLKFETYVAKLANKAMAKIVSDGIPSDAIIKSVFEKSKDANTLRNHFTELVKNPNKHVQSLFSESFMAEFSKSGFDIEKFEDYVTTVIRMQRHFARLLEYASLPQGMLTLDDIESFVTDVINEAETLKPVRNNGFYKEMVLEITSFSLDILGMNRVAAKDLVSTEDFPLFLEVDSDSSIDNPFSYKFFLQWYSAFTKSVNSEGMLTKESFKHCSDWKLCDAFVDRVFETSVLFDGCMDFAGFIRFVIAKHFNETANGARYFFNLFDVDGDGMIGPFDIEYFYNSLSCESKQTDTSLGTFVQEMLDKAQATEIGFTLEQFISCGSCDLIADVMSDYTEFGIYVACSSGQDDEEEEDDE